MKWIIDRSPFPFKTKRVTCYEWLKIEALDLKTKMDAYINTSIELWGKKLDYESEEVIMMFGSPQQKTEFQKRKFYGKILIFPHNLVFIGNQLSEVLVPTVEYW